MIVKQNGKVFTFGWNDVKKNFFFFNIFQQGQLGVGYNIDYQFYPMSLHPDYNNNIVDACVGEHFSLILNGKTKKNNSKHINKTREKFFLLEKMTKDNLGLIQTQTKFILQFLLQAQIKEFLNWHVDMNIVLC